jgi:hypothetical protein
MDYIINPMWIYWINVLSGLKILSSVLTGIAIGCALIAGVTWISTSLSDEEEKSVLKWLRIFFFCALGFAMIAIFIPSKETMIEMLVARFATRSNIALGVEQVKEIVDYIIATLNAMK